MGWWVLQTKDMHSAHHMRSHFFNVDSQRNDGGNGGAFTHHDGADDVLEVLEIWGWRCSVTGSNHAAECPATSDATIRGDNFTYLVVFTPTKKAGSRSRWIVAALCNALMMRWWVVVLLILITAHCHANFSHQQFKRLSLRDGGAVRGDDDALACFTLTNSFLLSGFIQTI